MAEPAQLFDLPPRRIIPGRRLTASLEAVLTTRDADDFETEPCQSLELTLEGIPDDRHHGASRVSGSREPWYPRGTEIRSWRQLSIVSVEELDAIAREMQLPSLEPGWIGANLVLSGIPDLSYLPAGTLIFAPGGAVIRVEQMNAPCRHAGAAIGRHNQDRTGLDLLFPKVAHRRRGLVASIDRAGTISAGEALKLRLGEQWIY